MINWYPWERSDVPIHDQLVLERGNPIMPIAPLRSCPHGGGRFTWCAWCAGFLC